MGYTINYNNTPNGEEKREQAIKDMRQYLTKEAFNTLATVAMIDDEYKTLSFYCGFAGVSGYPVVALWDQTRQEMRDMCE